MRTEPLGQMTNAPLALVLAQVRISPYLTIGSCIPAIQDALRGTYPAYRKSQMQTIEFGPGTAPNITTADRHHFVDADNRVGVIVQQDSIVFAATRYETFESFEAKHRVVLECLEKNVRNLFVEKLGLRYIDVIVPRKDEGPEQYVVEGLRGAKFEVGSPVASSAQYVAQWKLENGAMKFRFLTGVRSPFLPKDVQTLELGTPEVIQKAQAAYNEKRQIGVFDFDRSVDHRGSYHSSRLLELFAAMHADASKAFKRAMSNLAEQVWNSKAESL